MYEFSVRLLSVDAPPICESLWCDRTERIEPESERRVDIARAACTWSCARVDVHAADVDVRRVLQYEFQERVDLERQLAVNDSFGDALHVARLYNFRIEPAGDPRRWLERGAKQCRWYEEKESEFANGVTHVVYS